MPTLNRREFIVASTIAALATRTSAAQSPVASPVAVPAASPVASPSGSPVAMGNPLSECSMIYDVGSELSRGDISRSASGRAIL